jgi:lipopolysaccharide transport system ATP-binding protein
VIADGMRRLFKPRSKSGAREEFWALKDVSFDVAPGERVGIIGRNGAGKSTVLKVLSRITEPTTGRITMRGRVASLLEVGTGFHPELTGRENIYLNGAILGMSRREIATKFDEIVAFSEVEQFLDLPVKRFSSGMYVRLAFAVAAHLDPEILIVDEVLSVGDARFQKKCLGKMRDVGGEGRTVLFVSHNMGTIRELCTSGILMDGGQAKRYDDVKQAVSDYYDLNSQVDLENMPNLKLDSIGMRFTNIQINGYAISAQPIIMSGDPITVSIDYSSSQTGHRLVIAYAIRSRSDGAYVAFIHNEWEGAPMKTVANSRVTTTIYVPKLAPGTYLLEFLCWLDDAPAVDQCCVGEFVIQPVPSFKNKLTFSTYRSVLLLESDWTEDEISPPTSIGDPPFASSGRSSFDSF